MKVLYLNDQPFPINEDDFTIDRSDLDSDMCALPRRILHYGEMDSRFRLAVESRKVELEKLEADLDAEIRANHTGEKRQTEGQIQSEIIRDKRYQTLQQQILEVQSSWNTMKWIMNALEAKKECLISLSYKERQLLKMDRQ